MHEQGPGRTLPAGRTTENSDAADVHVGVFLGSLFDPEHTIGETRVAELREGKINTFIITPEDAGIERAKIEDLRGGEAEENATALRGVLDGQTGPYRDIVVLNAAGALCVAGKADDIRAGVTIATNAIDSGAARNALNTLIEITNG